MERNKEEFINETVIEMAIMKFFQYECIWVNEFYEAKLLTERIIEKYKKNVEEGVNEFLKITGLDKATEYRKEQAINKIFRNAGSELININGCN